MNVRSVSSPVLITLVHGTFATGAPWTRESSALRRFLADRLPGCRFEVCDWSGDNSHAARIAGAAKIREHVLNQRRVDGDAPHFIVAHSHGGMAAVYACRSEEVRRSISGIVTLGTPFIMVRKRDIRPAVRLFKLITGFASVYAWFSALGVTLLGWFIAVGLILIIIPEDRAHETQQTIAVIFVTIVTLVALFVVAIKGFQFVRQKGVTRDWVACTLRRLRRQQSEAFGVLNASYELSREVPVLVLTVRGDEARLWLRLLWRIGDAGHFIHEVIAYLSIRLPVVVLAVSVINFARKYYENLSYKAHYLTYFAHYIIKPILGAGRFVIEMVAVLTAILVVTHMMMATWPYTVRSHKFGYGEDSILYGWLLEIRAALIPGCAAQWIHRRILAPAFSLGRHSYFYQDLKTLRSIADWIEWRIGLARQPFVDEASPVEGNDARAIRIAAWLIMAIIAAWLIVVPKLLQWDSFN